MDENIYETRDLKENFNPLEWGKRACESLMDAFSPDELPPAGCWHYHQGVFLYGMVRLWEKIGGDRYFRYVKGYVDHLVDDYGNLVCRKDELDAIQAGVLLLKLHEVTNDERYKCVADRLFALHSTFNRTREGGYWHKDKNPYQMWLDGLYMSGVFSVLYADRFDRPEVYDDVLHHFRLMFRHTRDKESGLLYHAWDESRQAPWADPETGRSPEFWGRAIGWYGMALVDFLEVMPPDYKGIQELTAALRELVAGLVRFQDSRTGLWYQVVNRADRPDNWLETSCSAMFVYTIAKAVTGGYVDRRYTLAAERGYGGLLKKLRFDTAGRLVVPDICIGTGVGDYKHYVNRPRSENDLHGVGSFVLACVAMEGLLRRGGDKEAKNS